jgi:hypothetical protein
MAKQILSEEFRRMQKLAGIITEEQLNENIEQFEDYISGMWDASVSDEMEEGEYFEGVWEKEEYGDEEAYPNADEFNALSKYLASVGGKDTLEGNPDIDVELLPNGDIKFGATVTLDELPSDEEYKFDPASFFLAMDSNDPMAKTLIQNVKNAADSDVVKRYFIVDKLKNYAKTNPKAKDKLDDVIKFIYS